MLSGKTALLPLSYFVTTNSYTPLCDAGSWLDSSQVIDFPFDTMARRVDFHEHPTQRTTIVAHRGVQVFPLFLFSALSGTYRSLHVLDISMISQCLYTSLGQIGLRILFSLSV
jgi:hypothetical protein